jgi:hypothetical protein
MVFITQAQPMFDISSAAEFGQLCYLVPATMDMSIKRADFKEVWATLGYELRSYDGDYDYLVLIGSPVLIGLTVAAASAVSRNIALLQWDRHRQMYLPIRIDL